MARASSAVDAFTALAEPSRRDILMLLARGERPVGAIVTALGLSQPSVSKHLKVLRSTGLVDARRDGRRIFYRANGDAIRPLQEWTAAFDRLWRHQLARVAERAEGRSGPRAN